MEEKVSKDETDYRVILLAGGVAGTMVDILLFPVDTIKTRLQSEVGLRCSGGYRGLYSGLLSVSLGSAPSAALFFLAYEATKENLGSYLPTGGSYTTFTHMTAATVGDVVSCLLRVPVEVVKQRTQSLPSGSSYATFISTYRREGLPGFYRGYMSTVLREVPFSVLQLPLWEYLKRKCSERSGRPTTAVESAWCAAVAGGVAAALTNPLDVVKTRIMLAQQGTDEAKGNALSVMCHMFRSQGVTGLFAGVLPRVGLMSLGGAIFLGAYDKAKLYITSLSS